jgi:hypothetical protein
MRFLKQERALGSFWTSRNGPIAFANFMRTLSKIRLRLGRVLAAYDYNTKPVVCGRPVFRVSGESSARYETREESEV